MGAKRALVGVGEVERYNKGTVQYTEKLTHKTIHEDTVKSFIF